MTSVRIVGAALGGLLWLVGPVSAARDLSAAALVEEGPPEATAVMSGQAAAFPGTERVAPGRLIVKYRDTVDACAHCLFARGRTFASVTGNDRLDRAHASLGVHAIEPLFFDRHGLGAAAARAAQAQALDRVRARFPARAMRARGGPPPADLTAIYAVEIDESIEVFEAARRLSAEPDVVWAHPVYEAHTAYIPNDSFLASNGSWGQGYADQWGVFSANAPAAWDVTNGGGSVVAVVDTGIDTNHPDIAANVWTNTGETPENGVDDDGNGFIDDVVGWNFVEDDNDVFDDHGHGTHVAGIAAAAGDNALGIAGMAWGARVMAVRGLGRNGRGWTDDLSQAILYAAENGADVINNSWGGFSIAPELFDVVRTATSLGAVVVSAAGNDRQQISFPLWLPAGHPDGLTVASIDPDGAASSFSNYGPLISVAAPGADVLSLRSSGESAFDSSLNVGPDYIRLSGTSMATPHVAGAAALLMASEPLLTPAEVRWHLELGADQPGAPGYEGAPFNPTFGWGRLDAAASFAVPPVTTRLRPPKVTHWHAFQEQASIPGKPGSVLFTTLDPVPWTLSAPAGLVPETPVGTGPAELAMSIDATALAPGTYAGDVTVSAPSATDGGAGFSAALHVHQDLRPAPPILVDNQGWGDISGFVPAAASNGTSVLVSWRDPTVGLKYALVRSDGTVSAPVAVGGRYARNHIVASDGQGYLIAWLFEEDSGNRETQALQFARIDADGALIDTTPIEALRGPASLARFLTLTDAGFDGQRYWIAYQNDRYTGRGSTTLFVIGVNLDGSFLRRRKVERLSGGVMSRFTCATGRCMFVWMQWRPEATEPVTLKLIRSAYSLPVIDGFVVGEPTKVVADVYGLSGLATDGRDFMAISRRNIFCGFLDLCRTEVIAFRVDPNGQPIDTTAIEVSNAPDIDRVYPWTGGVGFDGTDWVVSYQAVAVNDTPFNDGSYLFVNRIDATGTPLATEYMGFLVDSNGRTSQSRLVDTVLGVVAVWEDGSGEVLDPADILAHPNFRDLKAQLIFPHEPGPDYQPVEIGAVGPQSIGEGELLRFRVLASGLDPASLVFSAANLPPGASFDAATGVFAWRPAGDQAGAYPGTVFTATASDGSVSETVDFSVTERVPSVSGRVVLGDGSPLSGAVLLVRGTIDRLRTVATDESGAYRIDNTVPGKRLKLKLAKPTRKLYRTTPKAIVTVAGAGDVVLPDLVARAK